MVTVRELNMYVIVIVTVAIMISIGATILTSLRDVQIDDATAMILNESITLTQSTTTELANQHIISFNITNISSYVVLHSNNYTFNLLDGELTLNNTATGGYSNGSYFANYIYNPETAQVNATTQGLLGLTNFSTWIPIMALVIAASAVIGVVMILFNRRSM